jgi:hypothetical protein
MTLAAKLRVEFSADQKGGSDFGGPEFEPTLRRVLDFANGIGAGQADLLFVDSRTVNASGNDDIDLAGALTDALGATVTAAEIVGLIVDSDPGNTTVLTVGVAGTNPWTTMFAASGDGIKVFPGGIFVNFARDASGLGAVGAGSADVLRIANASGASATYRIAVLARSA